jgi:hypothetical protein
MARNLEVTLISLTLIIFVLTPLIPTNLLLFIDHPVIRLGLLLSPFAFMSIGNRMALMSALCVGALFLERNARKVGNISSASWWNSVDGEAIPEPLVKMAHIESRKVTHQEPYLPENIDDAGCGEEESPVIESDLNMRPVFETIQGDSSIGYEINRIVRNSGAPVPMNEWTNANIDDLDNSISPF